MDIHVRDEIEADLPAIVDIWNQSIPACRSTADTQPITVAGRVVGFRKFDPARWRNKERPLPERGASPLSFPGTSLFAGLVCIAKRVFGIVGNVLFDLR